MKTEYEKCMAGEPFIGSRDPKIVEMILRTKRLLAQFNPQIMPIASAGGSCCVRCWDM